MHQLLIHYTRYCFKEGGDTQIATEVVLIEHEDEKVLQDKALKISQHYHGQKTMVVSCVII